eukprot:461075-Pleurochrysis_carterae.AAC.1
MRNPPAVRTGAGGGVADSAAPTTRGSSPPWLWGGEVWRPGGAREPQSTAGADAAAEEKGEERSAGAARGAEDGEVAPRAWRASLPA